MVLIVSHLMMLRLFKKNHKAFLKDHKSSIFEKLVPKFGSKIKKINYLQQNLA